MKLRVLVVAVSNRRRLNCSGLDSKARMLALRLKGRLPPAWKVDVEDLGNMPGGPTIQVCNSCVSTSMALCVWPCNCYARGDRDQPDLMWDHDLYGRLEAAHAWADAFARYVERKGKVPPGAWRVESRKRP